MNKKLKGITRKKIFLSFIFLLAFSSGAYAAAVAAPAATAVTAAPAVTAPAAPAAPSAPNVMAPSATGGTVAPQATGNILTGQQGIIIDGSAGANEAGPDSSAPTLESGQNSNTADTADAPATQLSEGQVNEYFENIITSRVDGGGIGALFRGLPRYGMSFFQRSPSTYAPMDSVPVAQDYRISVGDEMTLNIWGIPEEGVYSFKINRDGMASLPRIGAVRLAGYTFSDAERILRERLNKYYVGFSMELSMGKLSSILVYVTGNARRPGAYTISSFSTLVNALLASGGPSMTGSLRNIQLKRGGKTIANFDMYAMLMKGDKTQDVRLQAGDVIFIPPVGPLIGVAGEIQQPGVYEINGKTKVEDLLYIAGGLNARTFKGRIQYFRIVNHAYASAIEGTIDEFKKIDLQDGDILRLYPVFSYSTSVNITGPVFRPGTYAITPGITKLSEVVQRAGGLVMTASNIAEITRVTPSLEGPVNERFTVDIMQALAGDAQNDLRLEAYDTITVLVIPEWEMQLRVTIGGEVKRPGTYFMFPGERLSDLITRAGGFTSRAFLRGAIFTRTSVAAQQRQALSEMADQMERDLLQAMQDTRTGQTTANLQTEYTRRRELINNLRTIPVMGRVVTTIDTPKNIIGTEWDYELQNGDSLRIPEKPLVVHVLGAVYSSSSHIYRSNMGINAYINAAGGAIKTAHKRMVYLVKSDGTVIKLTRSTAMLSSKKWKAPRGFSAKVEPGDTIVVPVKYVDQTSITSLKDATDIIYKMAVAVGVIARW